AYHQPEYSHGNAYVHQPQLGYSHGTPYVHRETRAHARHIVATPTDALISHLPVTGCPAGRGTTMVARVGACTRAPLPVRHHIQQGRGLYEGASRTRVDSPRARARE